MLRSLLLLILALCIGIVVGENIMAYAYDPSIFEENAINLARTSYLSGCVYSNKSSYDDCVKSSIRYGKDISDIVHNKIWDR